jgi:hypothetical protein
MDYHHLLPQFTSGVKRLAKTVSRRVLPWIYWPAGAVCGVALLWTQPIIGALALATPTLLYLCTRRFGLDQVPLVIYLAPFVPVAMIAFFAGLNYRSSDDIQLTPGILFGAFVFITSTYGFARMIEQADAAYRKREAADRTAVVEHRLTLIKLVIATTLLFSLQSLACLVCLLALIRRGQLTAALAGIASGAVAVLSVVPGGVRIDWIMLVVGGKAAADWFLAAKNPNWTK